jgi:predicted PurR-regulated permease PerM
LGGIAAFGFVGLILGPVVMAAAVSLMRLLKTEQEDLTEREEELDDGYDN